MSKTPQPIGTTHDGKTWWSLPDGREAVQRPQHTDPAQLAAAMADGAIVAPLPPLPGGRDDRYCVLDPVPAGSCAAAARKLEEAAWLGKHPEAQPRKLVRVSLPARFDDVSLVEAAVRRMQPTSDGLATSNAASADPTLDHAVMVYAPLLAARAAGKRTSCAVKDCRDEATTAVMGLAGVAYACSDHGSGSKPVVPARIPAVLDDIPSALEPYRSDPSVMVHVDMGPWRPGVTGAGTIGVPAPFMGESASKAVMAEVMTEPRSKR
jgi:hypothetical protein